MHIFGSPSGLEGKQSWGKILKQIEINYGENFKNIPTYGTSAYSKGGSPGSVYANEKGEPFGVLVAGYP